MTDRSKSLLFFVRLIVISISEFRYIWAVMKSLYPITTVFFGIASKQADVSPETRNSSRHKYVTGRLGMGRGMVTPV